MIYTRKNISPIVLFLMFFYMYHVIFSFVYIPAFYIYGFLGLILLVIKKSFTSSISTEFTNYCWYYAGLFLFSFVSVIINATFDIIFLITLSSYIFHIFASIFLLTFSKAHIKSNNDIIRYFCSACMVQAIITLISFFNRGFRDFLRNIQIYTETDAAKYDVMSHRAFGLGSWFDYGSFIFGFSLIFIQYLYLRDEKNSYRYFVIYFIILAAGMLTARTIIVGFGMSLLYLFTAPKKYNAKKRLAIITTFSVILFFVILLLILFPDTIEQYSRTIRWALLLFYSIIDGGQTRVGSLDTLFGSMYFLPELAKTFIIGDGLINNQDGSFYMHTDAGYIRFIFYFGILGLLSFIFYQIYLGIVMFGKNENILLRNLKYLLIIYVFICFIKFRTNIVPVASLFFVLNYMMKPEIKSR